MGKLNDKKDWKGYKNAEDIHPSCDDGIAMHSICKDVGFYVQGVSYTQGEPPLKIQPHHEFKPVDCNKFVVVEFGIRTFWDCDTSRIPNPNRVVIIYSMDEKNSYEIPSKFVDWSKVQKWKPTFKMIEEK